MFLTSVSYIYAQAHGRAVFQWWSSFCHVRGAEGEPHRVGSGKGWQPCKILPGEKWPGAATTRTWGSSVTPCILLRERPLAAGTTGWVQRWKEQCIGYTHLNIEPLPCQLACWGGSQCTASGQACTQETRALHSAHARPPGCLAEHRGLRSRWAAHGISVLSSEARGSSRKTAGAAT